MFLKFSIWDYFEFLFWIQNEEFRDFIFFYQKICIATWDSVRCTLSQNFWLSTERFCIFIPSGPVDYTYSVDVSLKKTTFSAIFRSELCHLKNNEFVRSTNNGSIDTLWGRSIAYFLSTVAGKRDVTHNFPLSLPHLIDERLYEGNRLVSRSDEFLCGFCHENQNVETTDLRIVLAAFAWHFPLR